MRPRSLLGNRLQRSGPDPACWRAALVAEGGPARVPQRVLDLFGGVERWPTVGDDVELAVVLPRGAADVLQVAVLGGALGGRASDAPPRGVLGT